MACSIDIEVEWCQQCRMASNMFFKWKKQRPWCVLGFHGEIIYVGWHVCVRHLLDLLVCAWTLFGRIYWKLEALLALREEKQGGERRGVGGDLVFTLYHLNFELCTFTTNSSHFNFIFKTKSLPDKVVWEQLCPQDLTQRKGNGCHWAHRGLAGGACLC